MYRILLLDDEENILAALRRALNQSLSAKGIKASLETFSSGALALERIKEQPFDLVISDYRMPEMNGVSFLKAVRDIQPDAARVILSGYADHGALLQAINEAGITRFLEKPWDEAVMTQTICDVLQARDHALETESLADQMRVQRGLMTQEELELKRLEAESPGITKVNWGPDGSVLLDDFDDE